MTIKQTTNLFLIGLRGSGKTTIGPTVANLLQCDFVDLDERIQTQENKTIAQIFSEFGESYFRQLERDYLVEVARCQNTVISCGGGVVLNSQNRECLKNSGKCVWLRASAPFLLQRIEGDPTTACTRPKLTAFSGLAEIEQLLAEREPLYAACADYSIWVENRSVDELASEIAKWWQMDDK